MSETVVRTLFVCMGNICRSPMVQGVFLRSLRERPWGERVHVDSAGTHAYHVGKAPDPRAREAAARRGVDIWEQRARQVRPRDFEEFDYVIAMDRANLEVLKAACPPALHGKLHLLLDFAPGLKEREVPDPYYGTEPGFDKVFDLAELAVEGLLEDVEARFFRRA